MNAIDAVRGTDYHDTGLHHPDVEKAKLVAEFLTFLPADAVLHTTEDLHPYECDGLSAFRHLPMMVVLPNTVEQVQQIMRICHREKVPVIA